MKKLIAWLLLAAMMLSVVACSEAPVNEDENAADTTPSQIEEESTESVETEPEIAPPAFPETNMNGKVFNILGTTWYDYAPLAIVDLITEDYTGETLNDEVYDRLLYMNEKYNCTVAETLVTPEESLKRLNQANAANDGTVDFSLIRGTNMAAIITQGHLIDLTSVPNVDYSNPWWNQDSYESLTILNKHFVVTSDITTTDELATWCVYFNKRIVDEYQLGDMYAMVNDGTWTYDNVFTMASQVYKDLNSDSEVNYGDQFGISHSRDTTMGMFNSSGIVMAKNNEEGIPEFTYKDEESITKMVRLLEALYDKQTCINIHDPNRCTVGESQMFIDGNILFMFAGVHNARVLRDMNDEFGILPYPKYDENQAEYIPSTSGLFLTLLAVPKSSPDLDNLGIFLEEFAYYGYAHCRPAFYDTLLQRKIARDEESAEMLDLIFDNLSYDAGNIANYAGTALDIIYLTMSYTSNVASYAETRTKRETKQIQQLVDQVMALDGAAAADN